LRSFLVNSRAVADPPGVDARACDHVECNRWRVALAGHDHPKLVEYIIATLWLQ
jgi:hypothetical protein